MINTIKNIILLAMFSLADCASTLPVQGIFFKASRDQFHGEITGYLDRTGILSVTSISGKKCFGEF